MLIGRLALQFKATREGGVKPSLSKSGFEEGQLLQVFPRMQFEQLVRDNRAERHTRGFTCEICGGLASCEGKLVHLGVSYAPNKSTLSCANEHRPCQLYQNVFRLLFSSCQQAASGRRSFRFRNPLLSIDLCRHV